MFIFDFKINAAFTAGAIFVIIGIQSQLILGTGTYILKGDMIAYAKIYQPKWFSKFALIIAITSSTFLIIYGVHVNFSSLVSNETLLTSAPTAVLSNTIACQFDYDGPLRLDDINCNSEYFGNNNKLNAMTWNSNHTIKGTQHSLTE